MADTGLADLAASQGLQPAAPVPSAAPEPSAAPINSDYGASVYAHDLPNPQSLAQAPTDDGSLYHVFTSFYDQGVAANISIANNLDMADAARARIAQVKQLGGPTFADPSSPDAMRLANAQAEHDDNAAQMRQEDIMSGAALGPADGVPNPYEAPAFTNGIPTANLNALTQNLSNLAKSDSRFTGVDRPLQQSAINLRNQAVRDAATAYGSGGFVKYTAAALGSAAAAIIRDPLQTVAVLLGGGEDEGAFQLGKGLLGKLATHAATGAAVNAGMTAIAHPAMVRQAQDFGDPAPNFWSDLVQSAASGAALFAGGALLGHAGSAAVGAVARRLGQSADVMKQARMAAAASADMPPSPDGLAPDVAGVQARAAVRHIENPNAPPLVPAVAASDPAAAHAALTAAGQPLDPFEAANVLAGDPALIASARGSPELGRLGDIASLDPRARTMASMGEIPSDQAALVARVAPDPSDHLDLMQALQDRPQDNLDGARHVLADVIANKTMPETLRALAPNDGIGGFDLGLDGPVDDSDADVAARAMAHEAAQQAMAGETPDLNTTDAERASARQTLGDVDAARTGGVRPIQAFDPATLPPTPGRAVGTFMANARDLGIDAERMQFKSGGDAQGVLSTLRNGTQWDPAKANALIAWLDKNNSLWTVDGHQRAGLAQRLMADGHADIHLPATIFRETDGFSASDVRAIAAMKNISEGSGDAMDMAKVMRERPDLLDGSVSLSRTEARRAAHLARLSPEAFKMAINEVAPPEQAALIGEVLRDREDLHEPAMKALARFSPANEGEARALLHRVGMADVVKHEGRAQGALFGAEDDSNVGSEIRIVDQASKALRGDRALFSRVISGADRIEEAGSTIDRARAGEQQNEAGAAAQRLHSLAYMHGPVREALKVLAKDLSDGKINATKAASRFIDAIRSADQFEEAGNNGRGAGGNRQDEAGSGQAENSGQGGTGTAIEETGQSARPAAARTGLTPDAATPGAAGPVDREGFLADLVQNCIL